MTRTYLNITENGNKPPHSIFNIAHRGTRAFAPENTLPAFAKAKIFGCQMFEIDIRMSKDDRIIVYHDEHLLRCTDAATKFPNRSSYNVADFTYAELKELDAGSWYVAQLNLPRLERQPFLQSLTDEEIAEFISDEDRSLYTSETVKIPSLEETLSLAKHLNLMINIELKSPVDNPIKFIEDTLTLIYIENMADDVLISSFNHDYLRQIRQKDENLAIAVLNDPPINAPVTYLRKMKANAYNLNCYHDFQNDHFNSLSGCRYLAHLAKVNKSGFGVNIWTCNDPEEIGYLIDAGINGIISDYPNRVNSQLNKKTKISS